MTDLHPDLITIADAVQVISATSYRLLNEPREVEEKTSDAPTDLPPLVPALTADLYDRLYTRPSEPGGPRATPWVVHRDFMATLSAANTGRGTWDPDWTVRQVADSGEVVVGRHDLEIWAARRDVRTASGRISPGEVCRLRVPAEMRYLMKGFFYVFGDAAKGHDGAKSTSDADTETEPQWRFYWHLTSDAAATFVTATTSILNARSVPFHLKVLREPDKYLRADAGVLYLARRHALELDDALREIHETLAADLRPETPLLTHRLAKGLALVEAPPASSSYGQHRCRLIARALWQSFASGCVDRGHRLRSLATAFQQEGLDPRHPYLAPGSELEVFSPLVVAFSTRGATAANGSPGPTTTDLSHFPDLLLSPLDAAALIGRHLCEAAFWDRTGRLCNWMGRSPSEVSGSGAILPAAAALGPDLYGGSAGVALFLAQLHALTGDPDFRRAAIGAAARSLHQVCIQPDRLPAPLSLFAGRLGVAYAAHRVAALTGQPELHALAEALLDGLADELDKPHSLDLIGGNAGAISALLSLSRHIPSALKSDHHQALAVALGEQLCQKAIRNGTIWSWNPDEVSEPGMASAPLTGMSHGASGIAVALLELHAATCRPEFLAAARGAFAYEDSLFDANAGNWPDMRSADDGEIGPRPAFFCRAWCHGAPGIALARLRAIALDPEQAEFHLAMARAAIGTTLVAIDENLARPGHDASLCHGLAGLLETVLVAGRQLGDRHCLDRASTIARVLIERHARSCDYPSGLISCSVNPSLMLGLAGIGHAFLRLHAPAEVASVLLIGFCDR